jgi:hypothetical protein
MIAARDREIDSAAPDAVRNERRVVPESMSQS